MLQFLRELVLDGGELGGGEGGEVDWGFSLDGGLKGRRGGSWGWRGRTGLGLGLRT